MVVCADVGSTYTKVAVVDVAGGALVATAAHPTTAATDVMRGLDAAVAAVAGLLPGRDLSRWEVCSSAGGGLRLAVVGYEALVSAEAGQRVATSAGARVVHVAAGRLDRAGVAALRAVRPDVVLLVGGTDGGDADTVRHNAGRLAAARLRVPVVAAGNADAHDDVVAVLAAAGVPVVACANVLPRIGVLAPQPARAAIREVFLRHVIGGKRLSRDPRFAAAVRGATPDVVLTAVELLAERGAGDFAVVDVGGATTDVYSVVTPDAERAHGPAREVAGVLWRGRTVEGDLGVRWNAPGVVAAARAEKLVDEAEAEVLDAAARTRAADPGLLAADVAVDLRLAELAAVVALRRHARGEPAGGPGTPRRGGKDLGGVRLLVGSGGVLRHAPGPAGAAVLDAVLADHAGGWRLPRAAARRVDTAYVLAAVGLLAGDFPDAAVALAQRYMYAQ
ncbi:glutamate mutase L [Planosporangium sp. 12N6]|uniref:glutamate mutase L n=1 Tax=Planosporangium spinosum TaxID=3402278 RepID=UPI003CE6BA52